MITFFFLQNSSCFFIRFHCKTGNPGNFKEHNIALIAINKFLLLFALWQWNKCRLAHEDIGNDHYFLLRTKPYKHISSSPSPWCWLPLRGVGYNMFIMTRWRSSGQSSGLQIFWTRHIGWDDEKRSRMYRNRPHESQSNMFIHVLDWSGTIRQNYFDPYPEPVFFQWQSSGNPMCLELRPQCPLQCHWRKNRW